MRNLSHDSLFFAKQFHFFAKSFSLLSLQMTVALLLFHSQIQSSCLNNGVCLDCFLFPEVRKEIKEKSEWEMSEGEKGETEKVASGGL